MVKVLFIDDEPRAHRTLEIVLPDPYVLYSAYSARQRIEAVPAAGDHARRSSNPTAGSDGGAMSLADRIGATARVRPSFARTA